MEKELTIDEFIKSYNMIFSGDLPSIKEIREKGDGSELKSEEEIKKIKGNFYKNIKKNRSFGCLVKDCSNPPISSHSVQRAKIKELADPSSHIMMFNVAFETEERPKADVVYIGINKATTFPGLCNLHDTSIFSPIETQSISSSTAKQHHLFAYRAILREFYAKNKIYNLFQDFLSDYCQDKRNIDQFTLALMIKLCYENYLGFFYIEKIKHFFDKALLYSSFNLLDYGFRKLNKKVQILVNSAFTVKYDSKKRPINIYLNIVNENSETYIFFSTLKFQSDKLKKYTRNLNTLSDSDLELYLSELILKYVENFIISPKHWNSFSLEKQESIKEFYNQTMLKKDVTFNPILNNLFS